MHDRYTEFQKNIESVFWREPVKRAYGKIIVFAKANGKLSFETVDSERCDEIGRKIVIWSN